jgi:hypothetical protein
LHPLLHAGLSRRTVNYFFGWTTTISPGRVASFKDVTEELIVVQLLAWAGAGKVTISAGQCGHGRWLAVEARHRETTGHKQGEL